MKKGLVILLLLLVQCFAFASIYSGNANSETINCSHSKNIFTTEKKSANFWVDVFENENETEDETELDYHLLQLPITLLLNFDIVKALTQSFVFPTSNSENTLAKCSVFIVNRQILI